MYDTLGVICSINAIIEPEHGFTVLHAAAYHGNRKAVSTLLKLGADPNQTDYRGQSPLHLALRLNYN